MHVSTRYFTEHRENILISSPLRNALVAMSALPSHAQNTQQWFSNLVSRSERRGGSQRQGTLNEWFQRASAAGIDARLLNQNETHQDIVMSPPVAPPAPTGAQVCILYDILQYHGQALIFSETPTDTRDTVHARPNYVTREDLTEFGSDLLSSVTRSIKDMSGRVTATVNRNIEERGRAPTIIRSSTRKSGTPVRRSATINANHVSLEYRL